MISQAALTRTLGLIGDAVDRGATVLAGGRQLPRPGHFLEPTVLDHVHPDSLVLSEEIFGPVAPIARFATAQEALAAANATEYGLASYVYGPTLEAGHAFADQVEAGMVGVNTGIISNAAAPFGGIKSSGLGREGGAEGIQEYLSPQYIASPRATLT
jgi:succinate-semialdehyde dehydrogenase / glutarate-semialdehyde dehydrogenase